MYIVKTNTKKCQSEEKDYIVLIEFSPRLNEIQSLAFNKILSFQSIFQLYKRLKLRKMTISINDGQTGNE